MRYRIAYLTSKDPADKRVSSGVYYYQSRSLRKHCGDVYYIGPVNSFVITLLQKFIRIISKFGKKKQVGSHNLLISWIYGRIFTRRIKQGNYDLVFADKASAELAFLSTELPVIYSTDATFDLLHNYYSMFTGLTRLSIKHGNRIERQAIRKAHTVLCASHWSASSVINEYNRKMDRVFVQPRGANIDTVPDYEKVINRRLKPGTCRLLYMGHEWYRKGYDVAYETMKYLRSKGVEARLVAIGVEPPDEFIDENVELIGYIDKNTREGMELFEAEMLKADFYLLPTRAECMGIAFCEASAYGLPVITRDTGGVTEVVKNGINGFAMRYDAGPEEYGDTILSVISSEGDYLNLVKSTRKFFEDRLNWDVWGKTMKRIVDVHIGRLSETTLPREEVLEESKAFGETSVRR